LGVDGKIKGIALRVAVDVRCSEADLIGIVRQGQASGYEGECIILFA
jgi:hypothetical protein